MNDTPWRALLTLWMSLWHQMWFQSLHTGQALLYRHSWPIFGSLGPFWRPQKGNFMSKLIPFVAPNSHKSCLLAPEKIIRWPKVTRSWYIISVVKHDPFLNHWGSFRCPQKAILWTNKSIWNPSNGQYSIQSDQIAPLVTTQMEHHLTFGTKSG